MTPRLIYVAAPYRGAAEFQVMKNIRRAERMAEAVVREGAYPVVPHKCCEFLGGLAPDALFLEGGLELLRRCDGVIAYGDSAGVKAEIEEANRLMIPVRETTMKTAGHLEYSIGRLLQAIDRTINVKQRDSSVDGFFGGERK